MSNDAIPADPPDAERIGLGRTAGAPAVSGTLSFGTTGCGFTCGFGLVWRTLCFTVFFTTGFFTAGDCRTTGLC
jgi:hypothetical protein